ncbi:hypothetical protein M0R45_027958 [Rubus argutus]|uniref:Protein kinase domain-containing protein n=1 Tax=Rubus argutus TaxID=59490 RepID=A0AAW1W6B8_RUBAR
MDILPLLFLLVTMFPIIVKPISRAANDNECPVSRCRHDGPLIQFPFRQQYYPPHCGHPEFEVSCSSFSNNTMMKLSSSSGFFLIQSIDYERQQFRMYNEDGCLPRRLLNLTFSFSLFQLAPLYMDDSYCSVFNRFNRESKNFTLLNCTTAQNFSALVASTAVKWKYMPIKCLSVPGHHQVLATTEYFTPADLPVDSGCYTLAELYLPLRTIQIEDGNMDSYGCEPDNGLLLEWSEQKFPVCQKCRGMCYSNYSSNPVLKCYPLIQKHKGHVSTRLIVMGVSVCGFVIFSAMVAAIFYHFKPSNRREEKENQMKVEKFLDDHKSHVPTRYSYADIKKMTNGFKKKLGEGGFGSVFSGRLPINGIPVAIKVLKDSKGNGDDFVNEVGTIGRVHHVNVVRLLGFSAEGGKRALIYEHMPNRSLEKFITSKDQSSDNTAPFDWMKLCNIITGIAKGIEYLHQGCDQRILHFDIKPHNILLDHDFNPKISDFGQAKLCSKEDSIISMTAARGTIGYIAPEVFNGNFGTVSYKSDVYSFGMLVLEVIGSSRESALTSSNSEVYFPELIYKWLMQGEELDLELSDDGDAQIAKRLAIVALWCIQWYPVNRPSMKAVVRMLEGASESLIMPPNPFASTSNTEATTIVQHHQVIN